MAKRTPSRKAKSPKQAGGRAPARAPRRAPKAPAKRAPKAKRAATSRRASKGKATAARTRTAAKATPARARSAAAKGPAPKAAKSQVRRPGKAIVEFKERAAPLAPVAEARPLKIAVFGASGNIGRRIAKEALARGHRVTAVMRNPDRFDLRHPELRALRADATDPLLVATVAKGHDAIVSAIAPARDSPESLAQAATAILQGAREAGIKRVMVVNGAGSLLVGRGRMLMDSPQFPAQWRWIAQAHKDALDVLRSEGDGLDWTAVSPAALVEPGRRTGHFRTGGDELLADKSGASRISMEDYAAAFLDELEREKHVGRRMTVAY